MRLFEATMVILISDRWDRFGTKPRTSWLALIATILVLGHSSVQAQSSKVVILVRHAEKAQDPPSNPVLSEAGETRARALAHRLTDTQIDHIITSHLARTLLTARYVAEARGITAEVVPVDSGVEAHVLAVAEAVRARPAGEAILVVGHSNTIPSILHELGGTALPDLPDDAYSDLFILVIDPNGSARTIHATFD